MRITNSLSSTEAVAKMAAKYPDRASWNVEMYVTSAEAAAVSYTAAVMNFTKTTFKYVLFRWK